MDSPLPPHTSPANRTEPRKRVDRIYSEANDGDLDAWERLTFLPIIANRFELTEGQEKCLAKIEARVFSDDD